MAVGKDKSKGRTSSQQVIDPIQQQFLTQLYQGAGNVFERVNPQLMDAAQSAGQQAFGAGQQFLGAQQGIAQGTNPFIQNLLQRSSGENPYLQQQVNALGTDIGRFTQEALQGVGSGFASANQFGGNRQGLAEGQAIGRGLEEFQQGAAALRSNDLAQQTAAAGQAAMLQSQAATQGMAGAGQLFNLGLSPFLGQFAGLQQFGGILGDPTVLTSSTGRTDSSGFKIGIPEE